MSKVKENVKAEIIEHAEKYNDIHAEEEKIQKEVAQLYYTQDGYQKFRAELYALAGQSANDANSGGSTGAALKNASKTKKLFVNRLKSQGHDGLIIHTNFDSIAFGGENVQYVVFEPNQIKDITNAHPTTNDDIRFSKDAESFTYAGRTYKVNESTVKSDKYGKYLDINLDSEVQKLLEILPLHARSRFVKEYIKTRFRGIEFTLADGKKVVVTGKDAGKIASSSLPVKHKTALELNKLFDVATYKTTDEHVVHKKYSRFDYYDAVVKIGRERYNCVLNVGTAKRDGTLELYDVNQFNIKKEEAPVQFNELPPSAKAPGQLRTASSINNISDSEKNVNKNPKNSSDDDVRYSKTDGNGVRDFSKGEMHAYIANKTKRLKGTKVESEQLLNDLLMSDIFSRINDRPSVYAQVKIANKDDIATSLWIAKNGLDSNDYINFAYDIAGDIMDNAYIYDQTDDMIVENAKSTLEAITREFRGALRLSGISGEIRAAYGRSEARYLHMYWGKSKERGGGIAPDTIGTILAEHGIPIDDSLTGIEQFQEMVDLVAESRATLKDAVQKSPLYTEYSAKERDELRMAIMYQIEEYLSKGGKPTEYAKLLDNVNKRIEMYRHTNGIIDKAQKIKDFKKGRFTNANKYKDDIFKSSIEKLARIKHRGSFNASGTRKIIAGLNEWYSPQNPMLGYVGVNNPGDFNSDISDMLKEIAGGKGLLQVSEIKALDNVMSYFVHYAEHFDKIYKHEQWVATEPEAMRYINILHENEKIKTDVFAKLTQGRYAETFFEPMTLARRMDRYAENGFFTDTMGALRDGAITADLEEYRIRKPYEAFLAANRKYFSRFSEYTVDYNGHTIPKSVMIGVYLSLKREHAQPALALSGFSYFEKNGKIRVRIEGFAPNATTDALVASASKAELEKIASLLNETDKKYAQILEDAYNGELKALKVERDMQRLGYTNAKDGYYYPIRHVDIAENIDRINQDEELDRISNASFNKDTVKGAKQELLIFPADVLFNRHAKSVCLYYGLGSVIDTFNRVYQFNTSDNANRVVSVSTESHNAWSGGKKYISKVINDIQGVGVSSAAWDKILSRIRGSYATFALGLNPKVLLTQISSLFAASGILYNRSLISGFFVKSKDVDKYCPLAELRNADNAVAMSQSVSSKLGKFNAALMKPIGGVDRFVVRKIFGACQIQIQKDGGAKVGTVENKVAAGKLLYKVILETQQNAFATERSAAMRSGNEVMKGITMFTADGMKVACRVVDAVGELTTLKERLKTATDEATQKDIKSKMKKASRKVAKSIAALGTSALFNALVALLFRHLYARDEDKDKEEIAKTFVVDAAGNLLGGLPIIKDIYAFILDGYEVSNYTYSAVNDILNSAIDLIEISKKIISGELETQDVAKGIKNLSFSLGQLTGVPVRNFYNLMYGLTKRFSPATAYKVDSVLYKKNSVSDLYEAIENDDSEKLVSAIIDSAMKDKGLTSSDRVNNELIRLYKAGETSVLPSGTPDSIIIDGKKKQLSSEQKRLYSTYYSRATPEIEKLMDSPQYKELSTAQQAKVCRRVYYMYRSRAKYTALGMTEEEYGMLTKFVTGWSFALATIYNGSVTSDKDKNGKIVSGSKKQKVVTYIMGLNGITLDEKLFTIAYLGYSLDGVYGKYTEAELKTRVRRYIYSRDNLTESEKKNLRDRCNVNANSN